MSFHLPKRLEFALSATIIAAGCFAASAPSRSNSVRAIPPPIQSTTFTPLTPSTGLDPAKIALGRKLFNDPRLSRNGSISCASCHNLAAGGVDHLRFSRGVEGRVGDTNAPTVFNSGLNFRQFWNGRAATLEEQAAGPLQNPKEMDSNWETVSRVIEGDPDYRAAFRSLYGSQAYSRSVVDALATFERSLVTLDSDFDLYLKGNPSALNAEQIAGLQKFQRFGCVSCHQGKGLGGNMYQVIGVVQNYFKLRGGRYESDSGRFSVTRLETDRHVFKVPSLRNVALTAPYFHDGSAPTLETAVATMAKVQLGRTLTPRDVRDLVAFLRSLTGKPPATAFSEPKSRDLARETPPTR